MERPQPTTSASSFGEQERALHAGVESGNLGVVLRILQAGVLMLTPPRT